MPSLALQFADLARGSEQLLQGSLANPGPLTFGAVFAGGLLTSLGPCSLSLLPVTLAYLAGFADHSHDKGPLPWQRSLCFALGIVCSLVLLGLASGLMGRLYGSLPDQIPLLVAGLAWGPGRRWPTASFALSVLAFVGYWLLGGMPALCLLFSLGCLPLLVWGYGRLPLELWLFGVTSVMAYLLKQNTISLERHVFATVPLLMLYGAWFSAHPRWLGFVLGFGSLLSVIYSVRFAQGQWIG